MHLEVENEPLVRNLKRHISNEQIGAEEIDPYRGDDETQTEFLLPEERHRAGELALLPIARQLARELKL